MTDDELTERSYDRLAERSDRLDGWESPWGENPLQREYAWPATRALFPDVNDERVLDAGCGIGDHADWLVDAGATVVGVDASERAVASARDRFEASGASVTFHRADLTDPLEFAVDGEFDGVLSHLVLDHVADLGPVFAEFARVLDDGGWLVFTTVHPMQYYLAYDAVTNYYERQSVEVTWEAPVTSYHRPLDELLGDLLDAGFRLDEFDEPEPPEAYEAMANDEWNVGRRPQILCARARATTS